MTRMAAGSIQAFDIGSDDVLEAAEARLRPKRKVVTNNA